MGFGAVSERDFVNVYVFDVVCLVSKKYEIRDMKYILIISIIIIKPISMLNQFI